MSESFCTGCAFNDGVVGEQEGEALRIDTVGTVGRNVGKEQLLVAGWEKRKIVLVVVNVETPILGYCHEGLVLEGLRMRNMEVGEGAQSFQVGTQLRIAAVFLGGPDRCVDVI